MWGRHSCLPSWACADRNVRATLGQLPQWRIDDGTGGTVRQSCAASIHRVDRGLHSASEANGRPERWSPPSPAVMFSTTAEAADIPYGAGISACPRVQRRQECPRHNGVAAVSFASFTLSDHTTGSYDQPSPPAAGSAATVSRIMQRSLPRSYAPAKQEICARAAGNPRDP